MPDLVTAHSVYGDEWSDAGVLLELLTTRPSWWRDAACRKAPPDVTWFPELGQSTARAKAYCARCAVADECGAFAAAQDGLAGVWGGRSARAWRAERRGMPDAA